MLVETNPVKTLKLISGEEIICTLVKNNGDEIFVKKPLMFVLASKTEKLSNDVIFTPWIISMDFNTEIKIDAKNILTQINPSEISKEKYLEAIR